MADVKKWVRQNQRNSQGTPGKPFSKKAQKEEEMEEECDMKRWFQLVSIENWKRLFYLKINLYMIMVYTR